MTDLAALERELLAADPAGARKLLGELDSRGRAEARRWFRGLPPNPWSYDARGLTEHRLRRATMATFQIELLTPKQLLATRTWFLLGRHSDELTAQVLDKDEEWAAELVRVAGVTPLREGWRAVDAELVYRWVDRLCARDGLPVPWNDLLIRGWLRSCMWRNEWAGDVRAAGPPDPAAAAQRMRIDRRFADALRLAMGRPRLADFPEIVDVVADLVAAGDLERADVVQWCLAALDSPGRPSDQQTVTDILLDGRLPADDVPGGLARLQQLLATCHGSVTVRLLPLALDLLASAADVEELTATVAARPEKRQRAEVLRALTSDELRARVGDDAVLAALPLLAETQDAKFANQVARAIARIGGAASPASTPSTPATPATPGLDLWARLPEDTRPPNDRFYELTTFDDNAVRVIHRAALHHSLRHSLEPFDEPTALSLVVRWAWQDGPDEVRRRIGPARYPEPVGYEDTWLGRLLPAWIDGSMDNEKLPGWYVEYWRRTRLPRPSQPPPDPEFAGRHTMESLRRAGRVPFLLSTPTRPNGGLDLDVLVDRLRQSADFGFGPLDLLQAILRLRPVAPERAAELEGLPPVPPDTSGGTTTEVPDAVAYLRNTIASGRILPPFITPQRLIEEGWLDLDAPGGPRSPYYGDGGAGQPPREFWLAMLPVDPADLGSDLDELAPPHRLGHAITDYRHVAPWCPDVRLRSAGLWLQSDGSGIPRYLANSAGPMGVAVHDAVMREYATDRADSRQAAVEVTLEGISRRTYAPLAAMTAAAGRLAHGRLNLARCAQAWEQVFLAAGLRPMWYVALGTAEMAAAQQRKPPGLADLLRMLAQYVGEVPQPERTLPPALTRLAEEKGSTKSHAEARRLVAALEAP